MDAPELSQTARDNLQVIRQLMERATVYRAIQAAPALLGGVLTLLVAAVMLNRVEAVTREGFVLGWLGVLVATGGFNTVLLWREARRRGAAFPSMATLHGLKALAPPMVAGGLIGLVFAWADGDLVRGALLWSIGYGLGLLATGGFAPRSIRLLGSAFFAAGLGWFLWREIGAPDAGAGGNEVREATGFMAVTFGGFHLLYAARTGWWKRRGDD